MGEVVAAADEAGVGGADVVLAEAGVLVRCAFGGLERERNGVSVCYFGGVLSV